MPSVEFTKAEGDTIVRALASHDAQLAARFSASLKPPTNTVGGGRDQTAVIGHAPEHANWKPGDPSFQPQIDPSARIEAFVSIDAGIEVPTRIGARTWILKHAHVGHDAQIGDDVTIACHATIGGHVNVGAGAFIGLGAQIAPYRYIGPGAQVEMGSVVIHDVPKGARVGGNPARVLPPRRDDLFHRRPMEERLAQPMPGFEGEELEQLQEHA